MTTNETTKIAIPYPDLENPVLKLTAAPARLQIRPGGTELWVEGTYSEVEGGSGYKLSTSGSETHLATDWKVVKLRKGLPSFDLTLGTGQPFSLAIESGASDKNHCDFGGIPLTALDFKQGAGEFVLDFSRPSAVDMSTMTISAGASSIELRNLANANVAELSLTGGVASFLVDFCGELQRDMHARINSGMAEVKISAPRETAVKLQPNATLATVNVGDGFVTRDGAYWSEAAADGKAPILTIDLITALGSSRVWLV
ncbi:MAG: hypothetical protein AB7V46_03735 [Thermomicrobiales bacterium]